MDTSVRLPAKRLPCSLLRWHTFSLRNLAEKTDETRISPVVLPPAWLGAWRRGLRPLGPAASRLSDERRGRMGTRKPEHDRGARGFHRRRENQIFCREFDQRAQFL